MYRLLRPIHLDAGLALGLAVAMYAFTEFVILHGDWFPDEKTERTLTVAAHGASPGTPTVVREG